MSKDRYPATVTCPKCGVNATAYITENDGWKFMRDGAEREITNIEGSEISYSGSTLTCKKCEVKWEY